MKVKQKWVSLLVTVFAVTTIVGCAGNNGANKTNNGDTTNKGNEGTSEATDAPTTPVKLSIFTSDFNLPVPGGKTMDNPTFRYVAEKTNTDLDLIILPHGQYHDQRNIKIAAGEMADVVMDWGVPNELFANDQLIPLNDLIEQYGQNLKKVISQEAWDGVTRDGQIYAIPEMPKGNALVNRNLFVRQDLMEQVGYTTPPQTPDELLDMMRKMKELDPNMTPFTARENFTWLDSLVGMYGVSLWGGSLINGELVPSNTSPQMKEALGFIRQLMEEKLIDPEFMSNKRNTWEQKIQSGQAAVWTHAPDLIIDWQSRLDQSLPGSGAKVAVIMTPKAPGVEQAGFGRLPYNKTFSITKAAKNPEQAVKFFDWLASPEGEKFVNFGIPGDTYTEDNGNIFYNKQLDMDKQTQGIRSFQFSIIGWNEEYAKLQQGEAAIALLSQAYDVANKDGFDSLTLGMVSPKSPLPEVGEFGIPGTLFVETAAKIVLGEKPLDYFDEYVANWRKLGGDALVKEATEWYNSNKK
jgi:putative aldouronate transport system substrate-binding protein